MSRKELTLRTNTVLVFLSFASTADQILHTMSLLLLMRWVLQAYLIPFFKFLSAKTSSLVGGDLPALAKTFILALIERRAEQRWKRGLRRLPGNYMWEHQSFLFVIFEVYITKHFSSLDCKKKQSIYKCMMRQTFSHSTGLLGDLGVDPNVLGFRHLEVRQISFT